MFKRVLVANRGEIACRVLRTCERLGIETVAVFSDADVALPHVAMADQAIRLGAAPLKDSYLNVPALVSAIQLTSADAVHPGYGLLSENAGFARAVAAAGATFIGPPPEVLEAFGDKIRARQVARAAGVEPPPGSDGPIAASDHAELSRWAESIGLPLMVKAAGGGGGIGMQIVRQPTELQAAVRTCSDRGRVAFGDERVYLERYLASPRHIEVQVFVDDQGRAVALGERECSVQRRHQKIVEESPSPAGFFEGPEGESRRRQLHEQALAVVRSVGYRGAGTVEFVADPSGAAYFLEVNARLQVEHPVTELVTGLDLVELQLKIAAGEPLPDSARSATRRGHAIQARLYAEDAAKGFLPQPGRLERLTFPDGLPGIRIDAGYTAGTEITPHYDPLIAKIVAFAEQRSEAIQRLDAALAALDIALVGNKGPRTTNRDFLRRVLASEAFTSGQYSTDLALELV